MVVCMSLKKRNAVTLMQTMLIMGIVFLALFSMIAVPFYNSYKQKRAITTYQTLYFKLQEANRLYAYYNETSVNYFDTMKPVNVFAETYFTPFLKITNICKGNQDDCWNSPQYKDLLNKKFDKILYSFILSDKTIVGFSKNKDGLMTMIVDTDGLGGYNKLGKDIFVFYFYNNDNKPNICPENVYSKYIIPNGIHFGGYDLCGIPHDVHSFKELMDDGIVEGCTKESPINEYNLGLGVGAACGARINKNGWVMDKNYPW